MRWMGVAVLGCVGSIAVAQQAVATAPETTGTVVGHLFLVDGGGPARLAEVGLLPIEVKSDDRPDTWKDPPFRMYRTGLDGGYQISRVKPGSYYVVVKQPGYLSPFALFTNAQLSHPTPDDQQKIAAYLPVVSVIPNNTATMDIHLTRGASLSGTVSFDDGAPYPADRVTVMARDSKGKWQQTPHEGVPDDLGHFRITGLPEGDYLLQVYLTIDDLFVSNLLGQGSSASIGHYSLSYYSGNTARLRDAKPIRLDNSQDMSSADITIPVSKLHAVTGQIVEEKSGRAINGGTVRLYYSDGDKEEAMSVKVGPDEPVFRMAFVPEGVYTIKVSDAAEVNRQEISNGVGTYPPYQMKETVVRRYGPAEQALVVAGDVSGVNLTVSAVGKTGAGGGGGR